MAKAIPVPVVQTGFEQSIEAGKKAVGTIKIPASIDQSAFKNLNQPLGKITGLATEFEKSIAASNARVLAFGASVGILNAVSKGFKSILDNGIAVEKALGEIGAISGQSADQLNKLGDALFNVAKNTSQSFDTAAKSALEFSRQGLSVEETVKRTNDALSLTRFTSLSASEAVDTLTAAVNSFANTGLTTTQILNKLIAVDSAFAVSAEDLANGLARAGSVAQEVGVSFDELNGLITVAQEKTARGGAVIGNALKTIFTRIRSDETITALRSIGVESLDTAGNLRDVIPILTDLSVKLKDLSGGERIQILEAVASKYNINILSSLLGDIGNAESQFKKALGTGLGATNEATARQVELNKLLDVALNQASVSAGQLANNLAKIGLNDNLKSLVGYVNSFLDSINKLLTSNDTGGDLARGIIKGFSDVLFKVGLPIIAAIFIKLTKDIATFGVESLQTILGINQKVKERQALEQAVTNTLISNKGIMDQILAASGNRVKQEQILLKAYNDQIQALSTIQSISASVAPALQGAGLTATARGVTKKAASGYLPAQEAADVRRGVGGANSSAKVVSIPNFAFGGGQRGTMIANTSEYVVPNFANGGSAIFNQDMVKAYGLPTGAKKIGAAEGYIPNFAKYIYDSDRIPADKNATLKAILASSAKKNLLIAPAGAGKSTLAAGMGTFLTGAADVANATEIDILSGAGRTKDGGLSKNLEAIMAAVNASGGKVSYLYTKNFDILSRRGKRTDPSEGDLRSKKQLAGSMYAPLNQFDFMGMVKSRANSFEMMRGARGFIPNFAIQSIKKEPYAALVGKKIPSRTEKKYISKNEKNEIVASSSPKDNNSEAINFDVYGIPDKSVNEIDQIKENLATFGKSAAVQFAQQMTGGTLPTEKIQTKLSSTFNPGSLSAFAGTIFESSIGALLGDKEFKDFSEQSFTSAIDLNIANNAALKERFGIDPSILGLEAKGDDNQSLMNSVAKKLYQIGYQGREAFSKKRKIIERGEFRGNTPARYFEEGGQYYVEQEDGKFINSGKNLPDNYNWTDKQRVSKLPPRSVKASSGYIPNFAQGGPLEDAIQREMAAGLNPSQIRVTTDGKLKSPSNPNGFAVINTRDEPNGKIPNFARELSQDPRNIRRRELYAQRKNQQNASTGSLPDDEKSLLTTNKLLGAFTALTITTQTLQNTIGKTNEGFGKFAATISRTLSGVSAGALAGSAASGLFKTEKAKSLLGSAAKPIAKGLPLVGGIIGGAFEGYSDYQEGKQREKDLRLMGASEAANKQITQIQETSGSPEEIRQRLEEAYAASSSRSLNFNENIIEEQKSKKAQLSAKQKEYDVLTNDFRPVTPEKAEKTKALYNEIERLKQQVSDLGNSDKRQQMREVVAQEDLTIYQALLKLTEGTANAATREAKEKAIAEASLAARLPLEKEIYNITTAIAQNEADASIKSAKDYAQRIQAASSLSSLAEEYNAFLIGRDQIQEKINNLEKENLNNVVTELAKKATSSVNKEELFILLQKLKNGEDLLNVQDQLNRLGLGSLATNKKLIQDENDKTIKKRIGLEADKNIYQINELSKIQIKTQNSLLKDRLSLIENSINIQSRKQSFDEESKAEQDSLNRQIAIKNIREEIASKPFASNTDKVRLLEAEKAFALAEETARISEAANKRELNGYNERSAALLKLTKNQELFSAAQQESFAKEIEQANKISDIKKRNEELLKIRERIASSNYDIGSEPVAPAPVKKSITYKELYSADFSSGELMDSKARQKKYEQEQRDYQTVIDVREQKKIARASALAAELENQKRTEAQINDELEKATGTDKLRIQAIKTAYDYEQKIAKLRAVSPATAGAVRAMDQINIEASNFTENFSYNTTLGFRDGLRDALSAAVSGTDDLRGALEGVAQGFLKTMQQAFLQNASNNVMLGLSNAFPKIFQLPTTKSQGGYIQKFAGGGFVTGGSGIRDDVPAMLSAGEYVMRKSAVQKYGAENMAKMNNGGIFLPGVRGGSAISGYDQLSKFANQTTTSGATDILKGQRSAAFVNLEDQSVRLSRFGLLNEDTIKGEITSAQQQGLELIAKREAYRTQQRKAMQQQIVGTALSLAINMGVSKLTKTGAKGSATTGGVNTNIDNSAPDAYSGRAYGGLIRGFNYGGGPTDDIPALLMGGEYVMDRATVRKYGKQYLDSMNSGRAKFAEGGYAGTQTETTTESTDSKAKVDAKTGTAVNISINVSGGNSSVESQGQTSQGGVDYKKMSERIKAVVLETLNEEKRLGGSLRTR